MGLVDTGIEDAAVVENPVVEVRWLAHRPDGQMAFVGWLNW